MSRYRSLGDPDIDQFIQPQAMIELGLIKDNDNLISNVAKIGATIFKEAFEAKGHEIDTIAFTNMDDTTMEIDKSKPQTTTNIGDTSQTSTPSSTVTPQPFTFRPTPNAYALLLKSFFLNVKRRLGNSKANMKLIDEGVKPGVDR